MEKNSSKDEEAEPWESNHSDGKYFQLFNKYSRLEKKKTWSCLTAKMMILHFRDICIIEDIDIVVPGGKAWKKFTQSECLKLNSSKPIVSDPSKHMVF